MTISTIDNKDSGFIARAKTNDNDLYLDSKIAITFDQFGAVGDGVADDTQAILAAIADLKSKGGGVIQDLHGKTYITTQEIVVDFSDFHLEGVGCNAKMFDPSTAGSRILYRGQIDQALDVFRVETAFGDKISNCSFKGFCFHADNRAGRCFTIRSVDNVLMDNVTFENARVDALVFDTQQADMNDAKGSQGCYLEHVLVRLPTQADARGIVVTKTPGVDGFTTAHNTFVDITIYHNTGAGFVFGASDTNSIFRLRTQSAVAGSIGLLFEGSEVALAGADENYIGYARNNSVFMGHMGANCRIEAQGEVGWGEPSRDNIVQCYSLEASSRQSEPSIGPTAHCIINHARGIQRQALQNGVAYTAATQVDGIDEYFNVYDDLAAIGLPSSPAMYLKSNTNGAYPLIVEGVAAVPWKFETLDDGRLSIGSVSGGQTIRFTDAISLTGYTLVNNATPGVNTPIDVQRYMPIEVNGTTYKIALYLD